MIPPGVSLPGPFATARYRTSSLPHWLRTPASTLSSSNDFCTGTNPHRYDLVLSIQINKTSRFKTKHGKSATHANAELSGARFSARPLE